MSELFRVMLTSAFVMASSFGAAVIVLCLHEIDAHIPENNRGNFVVWRVLGILFFVFLILFISIWWIMFEL